MIVHYIQFLYPGLLMCETKENRIKSRDPLKVKLPKDSSTFAFRFFDTEETVVNNEVLKGKPKNWSGTYYFGGKVYTAEEAQNAFPDQTILLDNIRINGMKKVIKTRLGNIQEFRDIDTLLEQKEKKPKKKSVKIRR